ncbi:MAG: histidinol-phosphate transaminase [Tenericutes bacterium HGW-Tenericutes-6]|jgi:histidinol-phosphate aminotransferase|nr:MAG: histidinol-phosphate transaminase [Tenericutes bacterium HGW-Tenericutes-6]
MKKLLPRKAILALKPYQVIDEPYILKLDANESFNYFNERDFLELKNIELYPDYDSKDLRKALSSVLNIDDQYITMGNGSSELLDLLFRAYLRNGDTVLSFDPSFSMYEIYAKIYEANFIKIPSNKDFSLDINLMIENLSLNPKIILLCTPNNPTGYQIPEKDIFKLLNRTNALVIVDEAYMEFSSDDQTMIYDISNYENLVVLRTFSKAYGLAGARLGYMISSDTQTKLIKTIRSPYHVNALSQKLGVLALEKKDQVFQTINETKRIRSYVRDILISYGFKVYPSEGNFLWIKSPIINLGKRLKEKGVLIRYFSSYEKDYYRMTIKSLKEMNQCLGYIKEFIYETK